MIIKLHGRPSSISVYKDGSQNCDWPKVIVQESFPRYLEAYSIQIHGQLGKYPRFWFPGKSEPF